MGWFDQLEQRRTAVILALTLIAATAIAVTSMRTLVDYDAYWHLQMGKDWVESGLSPRVDHYSFTYAGRPISNPPFIFQALVHGAVDVLGEFGGFLAIKLAAFLLALALMLIWLRQIGAPVLVYCFTIPLLTVLLELRAHVRPELFSYALAIVALIIYRRTRLQLTFRAQCPVALLLLIWANYHSSIIGYIIFFGLFIDIALRLLREKTPLSSWLAWAGWGAIALGVGLVHPGVDHPAYRALMFSDEWKNLIQEYQAPTLYKAVPAIYVLFGFTALAGVLTFLQRKWGYLVITLVFTWLGLTMARMVTPGGIVVLCVLAHALTDLDLRGFITTLKSSTRKAVSVTALIAFLVSLLTSVQLARDYIDENSRSWQVFPAQLVDHLIDSGKSGRIFNEYELGGYLIHRLWPESEVYVDGRTGILYPLDHYRKLLEAKTFPDVFRTEVDHYGIDLAVLEAGSGAARLAARAGFELEYVDVLYALYDRRGGMLAASGRLWASPECWTEAWTPSLQSEWGLAILSLPPDAPIMPLLAAAQGYAAAPNRREFLSWEAAKPTAVHASRRFAGYRALELGDFELAYGQFVRIDNREPKDYLAGALAQLRAGQPGVAESILDQAMRVRWPNLDFNDLVIQHALLHEIAAQGHLEKFEDGYLETLAQQVGDEGLPARGVKLDVHHFCTLTADVSP